MLFNVCWLSKGVTVSEQLLKNKHILGFLIGHILVWFKHWMKTEMIIKHCY